MNSKNFIRRSLLLWLSFSLLCSALLYAEQIRRQYWDRDRDFSALWSAIGAVLTQNESVLPLLSGDEDLLALRKKFPQIVALEKTANRPLDAARVEPSGGNQYWLYNPWRQIRVRIDLQPMLETHHRFTALRLYLTDPVAAPDTTAFWHWQRPFPQHTQPFLLSAEAKPAWFQVSAGLFMLLILLCGAVTGVGRLFVWQRLQRQNAERRAWYYQHARLNTLGEITAGIVHEINQPLTAAQTWIQGAKRQVRQGNLDVTGQALDAALVQTQRISALLNRFREHVAEEKVDLQAVDLAECWQHVGNLLQHERSAKHIRITHDFPPDGRSILADRLWLEQVLHNLLSNAIQAQQERPAGWVHIASQRRAEHILVTLTDGGPGFTPEALEKAFMPFYSGRQAGIGLGMTLTESLVERMNGTISVHNAPEGGARIALQFTHPEETTHG